MEARMQKSGYGRFAETKDQRKPSFPRELEGAFDKKAYKRVRAEKPEDEEILETEVLEEEPVLINGEDTGAIESFLSEMTEDGIDDELEVDYEGKERNKFSMDNATFGGDSEEESEEAYEDDGELASLMGDETEDEFDAYGVAQLGRCYLIKKQVVECDDIQLTAYQEEVLDKMFESEKPKKKKKRT